MQSIITKAFILVNETEIRFLQFCNSASKYTYSQTSWENSGTQGKWNHPWNYDKVKKADKRLEKTKTKVEKSHRMMSSQGWGEAGN